MATFSFEKGYQSNSKRNAKGRHQRKQTRRKYGVKCNCFELELQCFHKIKERTTSLGDSIISNSKESTPAWMTHFGLDRNQNTQRHKTA